jgi:hypothetical protein
MCAKLTIAVTAAATSGTAGKKEPAKQTPLLGAPPQSHRLSVLAQCASGDVRANRSVFWS